MVCDPWPKMDTVICRSPEETTALGERWASRCGPGWGLVVSGDLGAGKTRLAGGIARGLGIAEPVSSPTFTLVHEYRSGRLPFYHIDLYRLETRPEIVHAGLEEYWWQLDGVTLVEWADRWGTASDWPPGWRHVLMEVLDDQTRRISYEDIGA